MVVDAGVDDRARGQVGLVLLPLLDGRAGGDQVVDAGEALHGLAGQVAVGHGWRTATTLRPAARRISATRLVVCDLPAPVRTAHTATTGTATSSVCSGRGRKSAPAARTLEATCMTSTWRTSE